MALELALLGNYYDNYIAPDYNNPLLGEEDKKRRDRRTPRIAIKRYSQSPFIYLYQSGNDQALLNCCGVDHVVFRELLHLFEPLYNSYTVDKNTGVIQKKTRDPTLGQLLGQLIQCNWYSVLAPHRVWGACDGLKLHLQQSGNWMKQNQYYNGWTCGTYVKSVLIFAPDSRIRACILNAPGCWHDSTQADYELYEKMELMYNKYLAKLVVDSALKLSRKPYLMWSCQSDPFNAADLTRYNELFKFKEK
eukprot:jgi/Psemu1/10126/gm1.10126_g